MSIQSYKFLLLVPLLTFIVGAIFPWRDGIAEGYFAHHRIMQIGLMLCVMLSLICLCQVSCIKRLDRSFAWGAIVYFAGGLASVLVAISSVNAGLEYLHWILLGVLFYYCIQASLSQNKSLSILAAFFLLAHGALIFLSCLYLSFALLNSDPLKASVIYPATENIRFFNQIQVFVLPLLLLLLKHPRFGLLAHLFFLANVLLICIGGARGAGLCLVLMLIWGWWFDRSLKKMIMRGALLSGIAILIYIGLRLLQPVGLQDLSRSGTSGRLDMWIDLIFRLDWHHLLWGIGPANYALLDDEFIYAHPHNSVLQWILEWGGLSFIGLAIVVSHIIIKSFKYLKSHPDDLITKGLFLSSSSALAYSLVDGVIVMPIAQTLLIIFLGLLFGRIFQGGETSSPELQSIQSSPWRSLLIGIVALLITVPYVYLASQYYLQQSASYQKVVGPRFWINGVPLQWPD